MQSALYPVRLTQKDVESIQRVFKEVFGIHDHIWVFGSRADLNKRGGDIDLYIETDLSSAEVFERKIKLAALLIQVIGDQKIDIVVKHKDAQNMDIYTEAKQTGVRIA